jgi:imidazolonepropionase-like amidohydrolase
LFDSRTGRLVPNQVLVIEGERITAVGSPSQVTVPKGPQIVDLSRAIVLPGLIDAHTHLFNVPKAGAEVSRETATLIAVHNVQADLRAGFTALRDMGSHGNGYADVDVRNAIDEGRFEGPRLQVSGRGVMWARGANRLNSIAVSSAEEARAAVREHVERGVDWIKLTHRLGRKAACHALGGEGQRNAIMARCDSIEHAFGLTQIDADEMAAKGLFYDPTFVRYLEPYQPVVKR